MARTAFHQAEIERILRAARKTGCIVQIDLKTMVATVIPSASIQPVSAPEIYAPDGKENWDE